MNKIRFTKEFWIKFAIAFAATVVFALFMVFVVLRGAFCNLYINKANSAVASQLYDKALSDFKVAKFWKSKNANVYIGFANTYIAKEDFAAAGSVIDEIINSGKITSQNDMELLYIARVKVYSAEGKFSEAANYIDSISDQYILKKIQAKRPSDLSYTPTQGSYDRTLKMEIKVGDGETVYYTTDGSYPTRFSTIYSEPIKIANGTTKVTAVAVSADGLISPILNATYTVKNDHEPVEFDDQKIEKMVMAALSKSSGTVTIKELESITALSNLEIDGFVRTLSDLDLMPNLEEICLDGETEMLSISQLASRPKMKILYLASCNLDTDKINALGSLTTLEHLDISNNSITSISPLANLTSLTYLQAIDNRISDLSPLANCKNLEYIDVTNNRLEAMPDFEESSALSYFFAKNNMISDLSTMHRFTNLVHLDLDGNKIKNAKSISNLVNLTSLMISNNPITNFEFLKPLINLESLDISGTSFVSLSNITSKKLVSLFVSNTQLSSLSTITNFPELVCLEIANTKVTDIAPLKGLSYLSDLNISNLKLSDPSPLFSLKNLYYLKATGHDFKGISFVNKDIMIVQ